MSDIQLNDSGKTYIIKLQNGENDVSLFVWRYNTAVDWLTVNNDVF